MGEAKNKEILEFMFNLKKPELPDNSGNKMVATQLLYGDRLSYIQGVLELIGKPVISMEEEFQRSINFKEYHTGQNNTCTEWTKAENQLELLQQKPEAANLTYDELMALNLYTGSMYPLVNDFLRQFQHADKNKRVELLSKKHTWVATVTHINSGIRKLCKLNKVFPETYRGVRGILTPEFFVPDKHGLIAATEYAFVSTSASYDEAMEFAKGAPRATVFVIRCRQEDAGGYHMGANVEWCSQAKKEREILFPPLTMFEILDRNRKDNITTITVAPHFI